MITDDELRQVMLNLKQAKRALYLPFIQQAMSEFGITTFLREAAFIAQLAHESAELRYMEEIASGAAYEGRRDLGNTQPSDGRRFKGRGPIQLTGRANYKRFGELLDLDLINNPTQAATPEVGFRIAGLYWKSRGLNELADQQNFRQITRRINGGFNGLADRIKYYDRAKRVLNQDATRAMPISSGVEEMRDVPSDLSRGILPGLENSASQSGAKKSATKKTGAKKSAKKAASKVGAKSAAKKGTAKTDAKKALTAKRAGGLQRAAKGGALRSGAGKGATKMSAAKRTTTGSKSGAKLATKRGGRS